MKQLLFTAFLFVSISAFPQFRDTVKTKFEFNMSDLRILYSAIDNTHGDHIEIKRMLDYINQEFARQHPLPKTDSTGKK